MVNDWNDLLAYDLVEEIHLMIGNVVLGEGVSVFEGKPDVSLRLIDRGGICLCEHSALSIFAML